MAPRSMANDPTYDDGIDYTDPSMYEDPYFMGDAPMGGGGVWDFSFDPTQDPELSQYPFFQDQPLGPSKPISVSQAMSLLKELNKPIQREGVNWNTLLDREINRYTNTGVGGLNYYDPKVQGVVDNYLNDLATGRNNVEEARRNFMFRANVGPDADKNGDFKNWNPRDKQAMLGILNRGYRTQQTMPQQASPIQQKMRLMEIMRMMLSMRQQKY